MSGVGYNLYITRAAEWSQNEGHEIGEVEWLALNVGEPFYWADGNVVCKNPDAAMIERMVEMARRLGARVQGDDGELYPRQTRAARRPPGFMERIQQVMRRAANRSDIPYAVGDRVRCSIRRQAGTIVRIDRGDQGGVLSTVTVRYDDGTQAKWGLPVATLEKI